MMGPISAGDASGIYGLLAALADPKAVKERLDDLSKQQQKTDKAAEDLLKKQKEYDKNVESVMHIRRGIDEKQAALSVREKELERREDAVLAREHQLAEAVKKANTEAELRARAQATLEQQYAERVRQLTHDRDQLHVDMNEFNRQYNTLKAKLAKVREINAAGE